MDYAAAIAAAAGASPMGGVSVPIVPSRTLLVDGDGLAYYCAGNDETDAGEARTRLVDKVKAAARMVGAEHTVILLTASGSHKGHRYAIARVKLYQGQRTNSKRPKNWQALRDFLVSKDCTFTVESTADAEADDLFGWWAYRYPEDVVIYTQDKDMRMLPGWHLDWVSHLMHKVEYNTSGTHGTFSVVPHDSKFNDKQYGHKWFWLQMLHGDTADNIPGLPKYVVDGKAKPVGEVTANRLLSGPGDIMHNVAYLYGTYYDQRWLVEMMEQACLLWMRRDPTAWDDCAEYGGPMYQFTDHEYWPAAYAEIEQRVRQADELNAANTAHAIETGLLTNIPKKGQWGFQCKG